MPQSMEDIVYHWRLRSLLELGLPVLSSGVDVVDPIMVLSGESLSDMVLEHHHVAVWNLFCVLWLIR